MLIARNMGKSYQRELNDFYKAVCSEDFLIQKVTKGAFTQARSKLSEQVFKNLDKVVVDKFYQGPNNSWSQYRLLAIDGSTVGLPKHPSISEDFGVHHFGPHADSPKSLARISMLFDVLNGITVDAQIAPYVSSEMALAEAHLAHVQENDLVIFDRYYASFKLMYELLEHKAAFCFRMKDNWFKEVELFQKEGLLDKIVTFNYEGKTFKVRLIKVVLSSTEQQILCTSVLDESFDLEDFKELYHTRWGIETDYRYLKEWLELENFSGKTALSIKQDFYAKIFIMNLCAALTYPVSEQIKKENKRYQLNKVDAIAATKALLIPAFYKPNIEENLHTFEQILLKAKNKVRNGRKFQRKKKPKVKYSIIYKNL